MHITPFILLSRQRSGSKFTTAVLNNCPEIALAGELFNPARHDRPGWFANQISKTASKPSLLKSFFCFPGTSNRDSVKGYLKDISDLDTFMKIDLLPQKERFQVTCTGYGLMYNQVDNLPGVTRRYFFERILPDSKIVHLIRENTFKLLLSRLTMEERRKSGANSPGHSTKVVKKIKLHIPANDSLLRQLQKLEDEKNNWVKSVSHCQKKINLSYEDLCREIESDQRDKKVMNQLFDFLGVEPPRKVAVELVKSNSNSLADIIENHEEVTSFLRNHGFSRYLS